MVNASGAVKISLTPLLTAEDLDAAAAKTPTFRPPGGSSDDTNESCPNARARCHWPGTDSHSQLSGGPPRGALRSHRRLLVVVVALGLVVECEVAADRRHSAGDQADHRERENSVDTLPTCS